MSTPEGRLSRASRRDAGARPRADRSPTDIVLDTDASLLDIVDNLLNKGVVVNGDVMLALAGVDLVYLQLSVLLTAADRLLPGASRKQPERAAKRRRGRA